MCGEKNNRNIIVILAGGKGERFSPNQPKQYTKICGRELLSYSIDEMKKVSNSNRIIVVLDNDEREIQRVGATYDVDVVGGGKDRAHSFQNALEYISKMYPECDKVVFHEAARPLISSKLVSKYFELLEKYDYVATCKKITDSLGSYVVRAPRREDYYLIQAPEAYRFSVITQYYDCESPIYFAANQFPEFIRGYQYFGVTNNIKLTNPEDKYLIENILERNSTLYKGE